MAEQRKKNGSPKRPRDSSMNCGGACGCPGAGVCSAATVGWLWNWLLWCLGRLHRDLCQETRPADQKSNRHHLQVLQRLVRDWQRGGQLLKRSPCPEVGFVARIAVLERIQSGVSREVNKLGEEYRNRRLDGTFHERLARIVRNGLGRAKRHIGAKNDPWGPG